MDITGIKGPVGRCKYCDQEFMRKGSLERHEREICPKRPKEEIVEQPKADMSNRQRFYKPMAVIGGAVIWGKK